MLQQTPNGEMTMNFKKMDGEGFFALPFRTTTEITILWLQFQIIHQMINTLKQF